MVQTAPCWELILSLSVDSLSRRMCPRLTLPASCSPKLFTVRSVASSRGWTSAKLQKRGRRTTRRNAWPTHAGMSAAAPQLLWNTALDEGGHTYYWNAETTATQARRMHAACTSHAHCTHNARTPHARRVHTACPPFALRRRCSPLLTAHRSPLTTQYEKPPEFETLLNEIATFEPSSLKPKESRKPFARGGLMHRHRSGRNTDRNTDRETDRRIEHRGPASYFSSRNTDRATDRGNEDESRGEPREDHARGATVHAPCSQHACTVHAPCMHRATQRAYTVHTTQRAHARPGAGRGAGGLATQARQ